MRLERGSGMYEVIKLMVISQKCAFFLQHVKSTHRVRFPPLVVHISLQYLIFIILIYAINLCSLRLLVDVYIEIVLVHFELLK